MPKVIRGEIEETKMSVRKLDKALLYKKLTRSAAKWIQALNLWIRLGCKETVAHLVAPSTGEMKSGEKQQPWGRLTVNVSQYQTAIASWVKHIGNTNITM